MTQATPIEKAFATLAARAALAGVEMHSMEGDDGGVMYVCTREAETRHFDTCHGVAAWLDSLGAPA